MAEGAELSMEAYHAMLLAGNMHIAVSFLISGLNGNRKVAIITAVVGVF